MKFQKLIDIKLEKCPRTRKESLNNIDADLECGCKFQNNPKDNRLQYINHLQKIQHFRKG